MISTIKREQVTVNKVRFDFVGLSTDTKPTDKAEGNTIGNASAFLEMDTSDLYLYNEAGGAWIKQGEE